MIFSTDLRLQGKGVPFLPQCVGAVEPQESPGRWSQGLPKAGSECMDGELNSREVMLM